ncbi:MAG: N-acetyl-gamma-glutamyl-phosphate reductase [Rhodospirillales bacterium]|nr:N-acetyl-gamma-glutamyl-phosphate reductase [Rhodospirillales bacterium]
MNPNEKLRVAVLGASGYTGAELLRFAVEHDGIEIAALTADRRAGEPVGAVYPHLAHIALPDMVAIDDVDWSGIDAVFCCLPHGTTQEVISGLPEHVKVVDLSADFRLYDTAVYASWYGGEHRAPELQKTAVYGLTEIRRDAVRDARLVANPGCYTTAAELPLIPCLEEGLIGTDGIIIDAKSGVSGAGRSPKEGNLHTEVSEGIHAYGIASHRHTPEIDQELSEAAGEPIQVTFTPHLMPMNRGILATTYVTMKDGATADDLRGALARRYEGEPFTRLVPQGQAPATRHVRGSNLCLIGVFADRVPGRAILVSALDNLVKGASGQALQNMNVMAGFEETKGLSRVAVFP